MTNKVEQKLETLYASYQSGRTAMAKVKEDSSVEPISNVAAGEIDDDAKQVISLYRSFQCSRIPDKEQVITSVMSIASSQQRHREAKQSSANSKVSLMTRLQNIFSVGSGIGWQTAAVFSMAVVVTTVVSFIYVEQEGAPPVSLASNSIEIPELLYQHHRDTVRNIPININAQFGFSSSYEDYQIAFRSGLLMVEMPLLARAEQQKKLQQVVLQASTVLTQANNPELTFAVKQLLTKLAANPSMAERISLTNNFSQRVQNYFDTHKSKPLFEFAKWLDIILLTTQLDNVDRSALAKKLLQQGKLKARVIDAEMIAEPALLELIKQVQSFDERSLVTNEDLRELHKKLQHIKAALL